MLHYVILNTNQYCYKYSDCRNISQAGLALGWLGSAEPGKSTHHSPDLAVNTRVSPILPVQMQILL